MAVSYKKGDNMTYCEADQSNPINLPNYQAELMKIAENQLDSETKTVRIYTHITRLPSPQKT